MTNALSLGTENLVSTYVSLAKSVQGTEIRTTDSWISCRNSLVSATCNFGILWQSSEDRVAELKDFAKSQKPFHIYEICEREHSARESLLPLHGFRYGSMLIGMEIENCKSDSQYEIELDFARNELDRYQISQQMGKQFFPHQPPSSRQTIVDATNNAGLPLAQIMAGGQTVGALMLSKTQGTIGLYNFFIEKEFQGLGLGTKAMAAIQKIAHNENCRLCLQCDPSLVEWYSQFGFKEAEYVDIWLLDPFSSIAIIE